MHRDAITTRTRKLIDLKEAEINALARQLRDHPDSVAAHNAQLLHGHVQAFVWMGVVLVSLAALMLWLAIPLSSIPFLLGTLSVFQAGQERARHETLFRAFLRSNP